ncbi:MAG: enoyl-CoA hydratase/isomerase family protein [Deltaproteobacteria bacterium]|nr:enoyl-CoA hydratase/isomerase family protein [Deltaproteobacteria bacterium]
MTRYETIIVEKDEKYIGDITLNRPDKLNTFSSEMAGELYDALVALDADCDVRVILIKGAGKAFCAGIDVNELSNKTAMEYREWIERMERPLLAISKLKKPVLAQVHGVAAANGMGLAAAADLVIASTDARMGLTAINVGLNCVGPVIPVARCVGRKKALELLLYGDLIDAREALALGLVNRIVPKEDLEAEAHRYAETLAQKSPIAVQIAKRAFYASEDMDYEKQFGYMNEAFARLCTTDDAKEGVLAFLEKRKPVWKEK